MGASMTSSSCFWVRTSPKRRAADGVRIASPMIRIASRCRVHWLLRSMVLSISAKVIFKVVPKACRAVIPFASARERTALGV